MFYPKYIVPAMMVTLTKLSLSNGFLMVGRRLAVNPQQHSLVGPLSPYTTTSTAVFSGFPMPPVMRMISTLFQTPTFASAEEIQKALADKRVTILDVRTPEEIETNGSWKSTVGDGNTWVNIPCTPIDATVLKETAANRIQDKTAPVLVHCASGMRSAKAKETLESLGYSNVINVGGWKEVQSFKN